MLVTGASGFIGSAVVRALLDAGCEVRALVEPGRDAANLDGLAVEQIAGDIRDPAVLDRAVAGVATVFHLAAVYRFWAADPDLFYDVNVGGARNVIRAMEAAGCRRLVYTSTVGTIGVAHDGRLATEDTLPRFDHLFGHYKKSKYQAEHEVLRAGAARAAGRARAPDVPGRRGRLRADADRAARSSSSSTAASPPTSTPRSTSCTSTTSHAVTCSRRDAVGPGGATCSAART